MLELVEGPTLADRIAQGPIPVDEALPIAKQIAEALEAAHEQGVIHRDLKPTNIKLRPDDTVKVLDFGLAKAMEGSGSDASESPTITAAATQQGVILGTAAYMSPEQARGKPVDKRSDIWAFGMVLWEMLTGHRVFHGETVSETLAAVMMKEPEWDRLPADLPSNLSNLVRRCLEKDPRERVRDIGDVRLAMKGAFETVSAPSEPVVVPQLQVWQRPVTAVVVALVLVTVTVLAVWTFTRPNILPTDITRSIIALPDTAPFDLAALGVALAISRDGTQIVYTAVSASGRQLYVRPVDQLVARPLPGGEGGIRPFFSPSGEWVGFDTDTDRGLVKKVPVSGGSPVTVVRNPRGALWGASWGLDDQIITSSATDGGLFRVSANGEEPEPLTDLEGGDLGHVFPAVIPGTNAVLFVPGPEGPVTILGEISVLDLDTREVTRLGLAGTSPHYAPTGHIVYGAAGGTIRAAPFDAASLAVTGDGLDPISWTHSERRIRCPRWCNQPRTDDHVGGLMTSSRRARCDSCSMRGRRSDAWPGIWI